MLVSWLSVQERTHALEESLEDTRKQMTQVELLKQVRLKVDFLKRYSPQWSRPTWLYLFSFFVCVLGGGVKFTRHLAQIRIDFFFISPKTQSAFNRLFL